MLFKKRNEEDEFKFAGTSYLPSVTTAGCDGDYVEYSCPESTMHMEGGKYYQRIDETALGELELNEITEEYGDFHIDNRCEIKYVSTKMLVNGEEEFTTMLELKGNKEDSMGFLVGDEIISPVTNVEEKKGSIIITLGDKKTLLQTYTLKDGICNHESALNMGLKKSKHNETGTYRRIGRRIEIQMAKYKDALVEYNNQYYNVIYKKI